MSTNRLVTILVILWTLFMVSTVVIALLQDDIAWGWWWAVPLGGLFVVSIIGFRVLVQRSADATERLDRELDDSGL